MNIYARFFDQETLVYTVEELVDFLSSIPDICLTEEIVNDIAAYIASDMPYPKRYKIRPRVYFILIKTTAASLEDFKANKSSVDAEQMDSEIVVRRDAKLSSLQEEHPGWYKGEIYFKRVIQIPGTNKFQYQDTHFSAYVKATSGVDCYTKIINHLKGRSDVDLRSQFPSVKGGNFKFEYLG